MCGFVGIVGQPVVDRDLLCRMRDTLSHPGHDDAGTYLDGDIALGFRRLSIIDLSTGHQPISNERKDVWVVLNGEIYNFQDLRRELEAKGHRFSTLSDAECVVHGY